MSGRDEREGIQREAMVHGKRKSDVVLIHQQMAGLV